MNRVGFKMRLKPGSAYEYKRRHDEIWPELSNLLKETGINEYSIFLDKESNSLFAYLKISENRSLNELKDSDLMKKWWAYMSDVTVSNADNSPMVLQLHEVFYLP